MPDDLDDQIRRAMKTLDDQVPSGYFEGLPNRTLARLEESSMQSTGTSENSSPVTAAPPQQDRDEDSGLHDIRSMASSTKMRISSRRISQPPPVDEDVLASSSAGWKAVALPEPARMISLPEIASLPAVETVTARDAIAPATKLDRQSKKDLIKERASAKKVEALGPVTAKVSDPIPDVPVTPIIGARFAQQTQQKSKAGLYAALGLGLAAAAGVAFFVMNNKSDAPASSASESTVARAPAITAEPIAPAPAAAMGAGSAAPLAEPAAVPPPPVEEKPADGLAAVDAKADRGAAKVGKAKKDAVAPKQEETKLEVKEPKEAKPEVKKGGEATGGEGEPSFDALLKEAGVEGKKPEKVKLDKKSLSSGDIKTGMGGVAGKAQGCFNGTQGTAQVKLTVSPSGDVQKVSVTGVFAGTPVAACVESAVKAAKFPAWDGGPQSFGYSYLLAE